MIYICSTCRKFNGWSRDADSFRQWVYSRMSSVVTVLNDRSYEQVLHSTEPWLVDFYAPWCGHCHVFAPDFEDIARVSKDECIVYIVYIVYLEYMFFYIYFLKFRITNHEIDTLLETLQRILNFSGLRLEEAGHVNSIIVLYFISRP